jgi:hypothetical protein
VRILIIIASFILTACNPSNVNFSDEYITQNQDNFIVEVPEVHELVNLMIAISQVGQQDTNMVNMKGIYHQKVMAHFLPFKNHPVIDLINAQIKYGINTTPQGTHRQVIDSYNYYNGWRMNAGGYVFSAKSRIVDDGIIHKMGFNYPEDPIKTHLHLIEDFAKVSGFRSFYVEHSDFYQTLIDTYKALNPIDKMKIWLEDNFPLSYGNYRVIFSPLVNGSHSTKSYKDNGFAQTVMFVSAANYVSKYSKTFNELRSSRVVFTEIDHNFVNPISSKHITDINRIFTERSYWANEKHAGTSAYSTPYKLFNEYMTWAVYSLYAIDNFDEEETEVYISSMEQQMMHRRGFINFEAFNRKLLATYQNRHEGQTVADLFSIMLAWAEKQII